MRTIDSGSPLSMGQLIVLRQNGCINQKETPNEIHIAHKMYKM